MVKQAAIVLALTGGVALADGCALVLQALNPPSPQYTRVAQAWIGDKEVFFEQVRVAQGTAHLVARREYPGVTIAFGADPTPPPPSCRALEPEGPQTWVVREALPEISGTRTLTYVFHGKRLVRVQVEEVGSIGFLFFRKAFRFEVVYDLSEE
ncbi:hypothetical protein [Marinithermus hydrothermalis]|uniref:Uncharacterized protein n=1 Tax=Marinithermus hydrothermalis (strain DSM 14884 / JCM 11576 / T1) TaxID=869210 RepID=F2NPQ4_MARHT|nr:hypothetical protein [Marinithermus hydrothermalis]AEB12830.1 hypothetical protein Marky_2105 [Marinithermus hydrothermalis DSM 14884]